METKVHTSEADTIPAPFRIDFNAFLKIITGPY
jgi:hypothetical protein